MEVPVTGVAVDRRAHVAHRLPRVALPNCAVSEELIGFRAVAQRRYRGARVGTGGVAVAGREGPVGPIEPRLRAEDLVGDDGEEDEGDGEDKPEPDRRRR